MNKQYYQEYYYLERENWWFRVRGDIIMNHLEKIIEKTPLRILNIGAATGKTSERLSAFGQVTSLEYDKDCCEFVREELKMEIINGSVTNLPFEDNSFDLVCAFDVIEHVENDELAVTEMMRVCLNNGLICITVPAFMYLWSHHDVVNQHFRRYTMSQLIKLFKGINGRIIYKSYFNTLLFPPIWGFRTLSRLIPLNKVRKGAGSDFTILNKESSANKVLYSIFSLEKALITKTRLPFGVSLLFTFKKN